MRMSDRESRLFTRAATASMSGHYGEVSIVVERDLIRTVLFTILLGGLACLVGYFSISVAKGEGRSIFQLTAACAGLLACGAVASRSRRWLRSLLLLGSLCVFALLVDQLVYYRWHKRVDGLVTTLQQSVESGLPIFPDRMNVRPTSFLIDPDQEVLLTFEPPVLAWTYHLEAASSLGRTLIHGWYGLLSTVARGRRLDGVARTIVQPHEAYSIGVKSDERTLVCQDGEKGHWTLSIETRLGDRPL
jgi:hypothetical protein